MKNDEPEMMESELRRQRPARPPQDLLARLQASLPSQSSARPRSESQAVRVADGWMAWLRWLMPVSAVGLVAFFSLRQISLPVNHRAAGINADEVQINRKLISSFDAVGELPGGEPVRFRVREWSDSTVLHDTARGLIVEQNTPRLEVIPVNFETY